MCVAKKKKEISTTSYVVLYVYGEYSVQTDKASGPVEIHQIHGFPLRTDKDLRQDRRRNKQNPGI